jgi:hypothetical protein
MVIKTILILVVIAVLMEDSASIKKTEEERKEDERLAIEVNKTLAEEKRREDEEKKRAEKKKMEGELKVQKVGEPEEEKKDKDEALPCFNLTCPAVKPCLPCKEEDCPKFGPCPEAKPCEECPEAVECPLCEECGPCPEIRPCKPCRPCGPDPVIHNETTPSVNQCPENQDPAMSIPVAMAVGAAASFLVIGVATAVGLVIRYVPPTVSGFFFLSTIIIMWYLSSQYPAVAREMGERVVTVLTEATVTLGNRVMVALQRHQEQVGFPV